MKKCPNCNATYDDSTKFCIKCGTLLEDAQPEAEETTVLNEQQVPETVQAEPQPEYQEAPVYQAPPAYQAPVNPDDHTSEMDAEDIAENKLYAILIYLLGPVGMIIALLAAKDSKFVTFHLKLNIKYIVVLTILAVAISLLCWTFIVPIAGAICICIVAVLEIISFVQCCKGEAKDAAIIKKIKFLK